MTRSIILVHIPWHCLFSPHSSISSPSPIDIRCELEVLGYFQFVQDLDRGRFVGIIGSLNTQLLTLLEPFLANVSITHAKSCALVPLTRLAIRVVLITGFG